MSDQDRKVPVYIGCKDPTLTQAWKQVTNLFGVVEFVTEPNDAQVVMVDEKSIAELYTPEQSFLVCCVTRKPSTDVPPNITEAFITESFIPTIVGIINAHKSKPWTPLEKDLPTSSAAADSKALKILVVDDKVKNRNAARKQLAGYYLVVVKNFPEAAKAMEQQQFDIVLTDLHMPQAARGALGQVKLGVEGAYGMLVVLTAGRLGVPAVGVVTDTNHHAEPFSAEFDVLSQDTMKIGRSTVRFMHASLGSDGAKNWSIALSTVGVSAVRDARING